MYLISALELLSDDLESSFIFGHVHPFLLLRIQGAPCTREGRTGAWWAEQDSRPPFPPQAPRADRAPNLPLRDAFSPQQLQKPRAEPPSPAQDSRGGACSPRPEQPGPRWQQLFTPPPPGPRAEGAAVRRLLLSVGFLWLRPDSWAGDPSPVSLGERLGPGCSHPVLSPPSAQPGSSPGTKQWPPSAWLLPEAQVLPLSHAELPVLGQGPSPSWPAGAGRASETGQGDAS